MTTDAEILEIVEANTPPGVTAASLSRQCEISRQRCGERLARLANEGQLHREELSSMVVYWPTEELSHQAANGGQRP